MFSIKPSRNNELSMIYLHGYYIATRKTRDSAERCIKISTFTPIESRRIREANKLVKP